MESYPVHWLARLLVLLPGVGNLARHVPELRRTPGQIALPLTWECYLVAGTVLCVLADRRGFWPAFLVQTVLVLGAYVLVDLVGIQLRGVWQRLAGDHAYRLCFWLLFSPGLMAGFFPGQLHLALIPGVRRLPLAIGLLLGLPLLLLGLLVAVRAYRTFSADRLLYMYVFHPEEGALADEGVFAFLRHPQYASFLYLDVGIVLLKGSFEAAALLLPILLFGVLRIPHEERELSARFGASYICYRHATPAFLPRRGAWRRFLWLLVEPSY